MGGGRKGRNDEKGEEGMDVKARAVVGRGRDKERGKRERLGSADGREGKRSRSKEVKKRGKKEGKKRVVTWQPRGGKKAICVSC